MKSEKSVIVLFGAGVYAKKYKALLEYLNRSFDFFTDNDSQKWGSVLYGKPVIEPGRLTQMNCRIMISCTHEDAIRTQLQEMGLENRILELEELYHGLEKSGTCHNAEHAEAKDGAVIIDMYEGIGWGGSEIWAAELAYGLRRYGKRVILLGGEEQPSLEEEYERMAIRISEKDTVLKMVELFEKHLPCTFVNNFAGCAFMAAAIVKHKHPGEIKIVSVIHNDKKNLMDAHMMLGKYTDAFFCVSRQIKKHFMEEYDVDFLRVFYREQPIRMEKRPSVKKRKEGIVRIGYAARLVKHQKRVDLLPELIKCLEEKKVDYVMQIAGEGECASSVLEFVEKNHLAHKIELPGRLPKSRMDEFWDRQDIVINISEYEGSSLSLLEAMAHGCVPVVTDVSGVREFVEHGTNGFICGVGDLDKMASYISELSSDMNKIEIFGRICRKIINEKCNFEKYIEYWVRTLI